jgi:uracil phosphoribosyltransferase
MTANLFVSRHPLVLDKLTRLRDASTPTPLFRLLVRQLSQLLFVEAAGDLATESITVRTPLTECAGECLLPRIGLAPILRAGLGMAEAILDLVPEASVWHLGLYRDHETLQPVTYYNKLPAKSDVDVLFVLDPMLATGGSAAAAIDILKAWGSVRIKLISLIAAPEGVSVLQTTHPDVALHLGVIDSHLNEQGYIVPGLGDAGDRQFGTH